MYKPQHMPAVESIPASSTAPETKASQVVAWLREHEEAIRRSIIVAVLYLLPAIWILQPVIIDPDIWWHLQAGRWMVDHGQLPDTDPFSAYGEGKPWVAYSWLFEIGMYGLVQLCGERGILLYTLLGIWLVMASIHRIVGTRMSDFFVVGGLMTASILTLSKMFTPRPWLLTIVFFALTLEVVLSLREGKKSGWFWALPLVYILWANIHIQFIYGLGLLGLACIAPLIDRIAQPYTGTQPLMVWGEERWKQLAAITVACAIATLVTPHHVRLYSIVVELAAQTGMWEYTQEMQALSFRSIADWAVLGLFALTLVHMGWRRSWSAFDMLLMAAAAFSAFRGQRDIWFLVLASLAVLAAHGQSRIKIPLPIVPRNGLLPIACMVVLGISIISVQRNFSEVEVRENTAKLYPIEAAALVEARQYEGPLYNHFNWGGYLIWRLPQFKVSMDGRANVHGDERIKKALATWGGEPQWNEDPELERAGLVIANRSYPLTSILKLDPRFQVVHEDETAVVFIRTSLRSGQPQASSFASESFPDGSGRLQTAVAP